MGQLFQGPGVQAASPGFTDPNRWEASCKVGTFEIDARIRRRSAGSRPSTSACSFSASSRFATTVLAGSAGSIKRVGARALLLQRIGHQADHRQPLGCLRGTSEFLVRACSLEASAVVSFNSASVSLAICAYRSRLYLARLVQLIFETPS
jgi:hypothetical protein